MRVSCVSHACLMHVSCVSHACLMRVSCVSHACLMLVSCLSHACLIPCRPTQSGSHCSRTTCMLTLKMGPVGASGGGRGPLLVDAGVLEGSRHLAEHGCWLALGRLLCLLATLQLTHLAATWILVSCGETGSSSVTSGSYRACVVRTGRWQSSACPCLNFESWGSQLNRPEISAK